MEVEEEEAQAVVEVVGDTILIMAVVEATDMEEEGEEELEEVTLVPIPLPGTPRRMTIQTKNGTHSLITSSKG